ncbi:MAG: CBS domain-containing protein [Desulfurococcales archaeon]|nr:CBS domain-containing protein [Desulfurococcales archaeon]
MRGGGGPRIRGRPGGPVRPRSRPEGIRWLRADGSPNWSQRLRRKEGDAKTIASRPPITISRSAPVMEAAEAIAERKVRGLIVADAKYRLEGIVLATDIVNYLGGGPFYNIVVGRHGGNIYSALRREPIQSIMNTSPVTVDVTVTIQDVVEVMVREGVGFLPVLYEDGSVYGVITERDVVRSLEPLPFDKKVEDYMTPTIVTVGVEATIKEASRLMVAHGFRRLPVTDDKGEIKGVVTAKDIVSFFGSHEAFKFVKEGKMEEALSTPVYYVMTPEFYTIHPKLSVADAAKRMIEKGVDSLIVTEGEEALGIITERDVLIAAAVGEE